jgi:acyl-coenzyme A thioesterase PaaI-like protein
MSSEKKAVQDYYPEDVAHCYGCGRLNPEGIQLKTVWEGEETVSRYTPRSYHTAIPGYVYGGLIASLLDCHGTGGAAAAMLRREGREIGEGEAPRFVTASLQVDFLKPTPLGPELVVRGKIIEITDRKVVLEEALSAEGVVTARGRVVAVRMPEGMIP